VAGVRVTPPGRSVLVTPGMLSVPGMFVVRGVLCVPGMLVMPGVLIAAGVAGVSSVDVRLVRLTSRGVSGLAARRGALFALASVPLVLQESVQAGGVEPGWVVGDVDHRPRTVRGRGSHTRRVGEAALQPGKFGAAEAEVEYHLGDCAVGRPVERVAAVLTYMVVRCHG
jgi:hypothetical protein